MPSPPSTVFLPEHAFIDRLASQVKAGFGLVPFLGSGCSSNSGILMGEQFTDYLAWVVYLCVVKSRADDGRLWNLLERGWPRHPSDAQVLEARTWALSEFSALAKSCGLSVDDNPLTCRVRGVHAEAGLGTPEALARFLYAPLVPPFLRDPASPPDDKSLHRLHGLLDERGVLYGGLTRPDISPTSTDAIVERAIRSLYDWRATLRFLSELKLGPDDHTMFLVAPDAAVIDGFNVHITHGRRPNLVHTMLCHLRQPARMRVIMTTNFDTLIEDAFAEQGRRMDVISVSIKGELPHADIVHARDTVLKLHGSTSETRADFSLDAPPSASDRRRFFQYVRGRPPGDDGGFIPSHLLVAGYSGSDVRCVELIKTLLDQDPHALVFWVCHTKRDLDRLPLIFLESYNERVVATRSESVALLLYEHTPSTTTSRRKRASAPV
jgi:hypothetical protein